LCGAAQAAGGNKEAVENMEKNGRYLKLERLPRGTLAEHISDVRVTDGSAQAARVAGYGNIRIDEDAVFSSAYIPLVAQSGAEFTRSGDFFVEFAVKIDALSRIVVRPEHRVITFTVSVDALMKLDAGSKNGVLCFFDGVAAGFDAAVIPLVYYNNRSFNGQDFSGSGISSSPSPFSPTPSPPSSSRGKITASPSPLPPTPILTP
jgi:hypothetical protein